MDDDYQAMRKHNKKYKESSYQIMRRRQKQSNVFFCIQLLVNLPIFLFLVSFLVFDPGYECWASQHDNIATAYDINNSRTNVSNQWKSLHIIGITSILVQSISYIILFNEEACFGICNAVNLAGLILQFFWLVFATVSRFKHTGRVCSGVFLDNLPAPKPYLYDQGLFW